MKKRRINLILDEETYKKLLEVRLNLSRKRASAEVDWKDVIEELLSKYRGE